MVVDMLARVLLLYAVTVFWGVGVDMELLECCYAVEDVLGGGC